MFNHIISALAALIMGLLANSGTALSEGKRYALLIGNQAYDASVGALRNPHNDIALVAEALKKQGFEILPLVKDARRSAILGAVRELVRHLNASGASPIGFVYYSGHGAAEKDTNINYLIPIDARDPGSTTFWDESLKLDDIMRLLDGARRAVKFVVFDACRNELQLPTRDTSKGFLPVAEQQGIFVAYASAPGRTASDRGATSGPYAAALVKELGRQGFDHLNFFQNVKETVIASTGGSQQPWESNGLTRRVYLTGEPTMPADIALWESVRSSNDIASLHGYLERFPSGVFAATAAQMIERLKTEAAQRAVAEQFAIQLKTQAAKQTAELQGALDEARKSRAALSIAEQQRAQADAIAEEARTTVAAAQSERNAAVAREEELRKIQQQLKAESANSSTRSAVEVAAATAELERKLEAVAGEARAAHEALAAAENKRQAAEQAAAKAQEQARLSQVAMESRVADVALPPQASESLRQVRPTPLFTERDATQIREISDKYRLFPLDFSIEAPDADVPAALRRFIGVWFDESGYKGKGRRHMLIVTGAESSGRAFGFLLYGPPTINSFSQGPAGVHKFDGIISGDRLTFTALGGREMMKMTLGSNARMHYAWQNTKGQNSSTTLNPVWILVNAERSNGR